MQQTPWLAAGRYEVGEVVGQGGYGMVYRGMDRQTGRRVALKMLSPEAGRDADVVERMLREQQALVTLSGTCAVTAIDLCRLDSGAPCLVMEWLDGCDLEQQLTAWEAAGERGSTQLLLQILRPLTQTLERAHQLGLVHRDIKPANIFLTPDTAPGVRLLDFGLSRMKSAAPLTAFGMVMGSPSYIAPETWRALEAALRGEAWPKAASADASGVQIAASAKTNADSSARKNALAGAWRAAASLLKRFTGARDRKTASDRETPLETPRAKTPPPSVLREPVDESSASDRKTLWLDSEELEDVAPTAKPAAAPTPILTPKQQPRPTAKAKPKSKTSHTVKPPKVAKKSPAKSKSKRKSKSKAKPQSKPKASRHKASSRPRKR